jgi:hypothetical protein
MDLDQNLVLDQDPRVKALSRNLPAKVEVEAEAKVPEKLARVRLVLPLQINH